VSGRESLSVVVTAYQEEEALGPLITELYRDLSDVTSLEVIIVNDGSTDRTAEVMASFIHPEHRPGRLVCHHLPHNMGMGAALKAGYELASEGWVTFLPGDGQLMPSSLLTLCDEAERSGVRLVTTRYTNRTFTPLRWVLSKGLRVANVLIMGQRVYSEGMYLIERELLHSLPLTSNSFMLNLELPLRVSRLGEAVSVAWVEVRARQGGVSSAARVGRVWSTLRDLLALRITLEKERLRGARVSVSLLLSVLKVLLIGGVVWWAASRGLLTQAFTHLKVLSPLSLLSGWALMGVGLSLGAQRWRTLLKAAHLYQPSPSQALRLCYEGLFFNALVPGSVGGDLLRAHWLKKRDPEGTSLHYLITLGERALGMSSLGLLMMVGVAPAWLSALGLAFTTLLVTLSPKLIESLTQPSSVSNTPPSRLTRLKDYLRPLTRLSPARLGLALLINTLGHLSSFALFIVIAADMGVHLPLSAWFVSLSISLFMANLPLSIAGVGPRELSMVATLGAYGVAREQALALSLTSLALLLTHALCGGLLHLVSPLQPTSTSQDHP
jgi:glycosyltransferase involved in cell wall biosynthesis